MNITTVTILLLKSVCFGSNLAVLGCVYSSDVFTTHPLGHIHPKFDGGIVA